MAADNGRTAKAAMTRAAEATLRGDPAAVRLATAALAMLAAQEAAERAIAAAKGLPGVSQGAV